MTDQNADGLTTVFAYHARSKHRPERYARSAGYLDWANQPNPFREFQGAPAIGLIIPEAQAGPRYDALFEQFPQPASFDPESVSRLFFYGMSISAWKKVPGGEAWPLRVNPSSGNLHPTESWLICGPAESEELCGVFHYAVDRHSLEQRMRLDAEQWNRLVGEQAGSGFLLGLSSVCWREAWKYGERAYRYTNHDVGHALGALAVSAGSLGWSLNLLEVASDSVARLMGLGSEPAEERERADCLLWVSTSVPLDPDAVQRLSRRIEAAASESGFDGQAGGANQLSAKHQDWPVVEQIAEACEAHFLQDRQGVHPPQPNALRGISASAAALREIGVWDLVRQRRSAVAMDAETSIPLADFLRMLWRVLPGNGFPWSVMPGEANISLVLFVHRIDGLEPGVYVLIRDPDHLPALQAAMRSEMNWEKSPGCEDLPLYQILAGDCRQAAQIISCHQDIAADGAFACGMLARFRAELEAAGPAGYPRLYWETGLIGQILYLEAEAAGVRATGIGCFFDDTLHDLLGIANDDWQSLYHFTVGGPVEDTRLQTLPAYVDSPEESP